MDGNRRTVLTVLTVRQTNRATAGGQGKRTADKQGFPFWLLAESSALEYPHTQLYLLDDGELVILSVCLGIALFYNWG